MLEEIPVDYNAEDYDEDLKQFLIEHALVNTKIDVQEINLVYKLEKYYELINVKKGIIQNK